MARGRLFFIIVVVGLAAALAWWTTRNTPGAAMRLTPMRFADLPGWGQTDPRTALTAFGRSCRALAAKPAQAAMGGAGYAGSVGDWWGICAALPKSAASSASARRFFENWFVPVAVSARGDPEGTYTGYYEPELRGSRTEHGRYRTPVYATPDNLLTADLKRFRSDLPDTHITGCIDGHRLLPCPARAEIDARGLSNAKVLFYADDPITVFFLHIQGSGRVRFDDGSFERVAYDGQNGKPYTPIGRTLIEEDALPRDGMSMQVLRSWLHDHPADARRIMETDQSFVFFREAPVGDPALGSEGSEGVALTPAASLAVDQKLHPLGAPIFVRAMRPDANPSKPDHVFDQLMVAQDTGGAINGAVRGDIFWGFGAEAESIAGRMKSKGTFYVLLPKPLATHLAPYKDYMASAP